MEVVVVTGWKGEGLFLFGEEEDEKEQQRPRRVTSIAELGLGADK